MSDLRTNMAQYSGALRADVVMQCVTAMAELNGGLCFVWLNPALSDLLGAGTWRWQGAQLDAIDPGASGIVGAARRALDFDQVVLIRQVAVRRGSDQERVVDLAFSPLGGERLLLEVHAAAVTPERTSPALSESLRGFAHEVKNPLAGIRGAAQLIGRRVESGELRELAELIIGESDRLTTLADRLLRAGGKPRLARLNVHELLERVARLIASEAGGPSVRRDYDPSLPALTGDADRLLQLVLNLARNAIEAGAGQLTLRTRVEFGARLNERLRRAVLRIDVIDDGHGIPPELHETLYQPLVSGRPDGSGLGLALAREIADEHGGELRHVSRAGATTFTLLLPLELSP
ncbi:MAG: ATP-binding protein [Dokdonella sp.]